MGCDDDVEIIDDLSAIFFFLFSSSQGMGFLLIQNTNMLRNLQLKNVLEHVDKVLFPLLVGYLGLGKKKNMC